MPTARIWRVIMRTKTFLFLLVLFGYALASVAAQSVSNPYGVNKEAVALNGQGTAQFKDGHYDQALELFGRAVQLDPAFVVALNNLGATYNVLGQYDKAVTVLNRALRGQPNFTEAYYELGVAYE